MSFRMNGIIFWINIKAQFYPNALFGDVTNNNFICAVIAWFYHLRSGVEVRKAEASVIFRNAIPKNSEKAFNNLTPIPEDTKHQLFINFGIKEIHKDNILRPLPQRTTIMS